jgi:UDP-GlcNAc:undecaprenyl-phosphate GlcNAc-1-phosphate transferase
MGLVDDFHNLRARLKFIVQLAAATLVTVGGFTISTVRIPGLGTYSLGLFSYPITVLWIVAISNAINLVDGVDGLAGGISAFAALSLGLVSLVQGHPIPALFAFALLGAVIGFLAFNFPPARIFMGDSGSLLLGCVLASLPLLATPGETSISDLFAPATVLLIPILDTVSAVVRRVKGRRAILSPDKEHIHHKLLALGWKETSILAIVYGFCLCFGVAAFGSMFLARGAALALLGSVWVAALIAFAVLNSATRRSKLAAPDLQGRP